MPSLNSSTHFLEQFFQHSSEGVVYCDQMGILQDWNPALEAITGFVKSQVVGKKAQDVLPNIFGKNIFVEKNQFLNMTKNIYSLKYVSLEDGEICLLSDVTEKVRRQSMDLETENRFKNLANTMAQLVWITDVQGQNVEYVNERWYLYTGQSTKEQFLREHWLEVIHPEDVVEVRRNHLESVKNSTDFSVEYRLKRHDGEYRWHLARTVVVRDHAGIAHRRFGTATDIHDQKIALTKIQQTEKNLVTLKRVGETLVSELNLEKLATAVVEASRELSHAHFAAFFYHPGMGGSADLGYSVSGISKTKFEQFLKEQTKLAFHPQFLMEAIVNIPDLLNDPRYGKGHPYREIPVEGDSLRSLVSLPVATRQGEVIGTLFLGDEKVGFFTKELETILLGLISQVAIASDNARLYKKLQESVKARDEFLSMASHELKTPLTSLILQHEMRKRILVQDCSDDKKEMLIETFNRGTNQLVKLNRLIDDMLDISRIRTGRLELRKQMINFSYLLYDVVENLRTQLQEACGEAHLDIVEMEMWVDADPFRMEQVLTNLLTNAMKYGNGKPIRIEANIVDGEKAWVAIKDQGIGISSQDQKRIFTRFERAIPANEVSGLGLGLAIVKDIVEAHQGNISVESELSRGSTFMVELPLLR